MRRLTPLSLTFLALACAAAPAGAQKGARPAARKTAPKPAPKPAPRKPAPKPAAAPVPTRAAEELQLLRQVAAGEPQAFDTLYQRYTPALRRFLRRRLPHPDLVDEVCHDVLLVAWQQAGRFQANARLSTWLCGIARHRVQKAWQRVARQHAAEVQVLQRQIDDEVLV